ncbi:MAG TPA: UDP-N-acetylglucosamine 2-epimerase (non-hydrolyzing) [Candidatus Deferrimicrobium sp.]|nr:UDP-N-acetylglucosamine 2-epimerase (non-hydrolyzing) [Candidatus Deferrimicrobium sp.]
MKARPTVISVVGARPQFIKLAALAKALAAKFRHLIVHTGQHADVDMSDIFFRQLKIPKPHVNLGVSGGTHGAMTARMLERLEKVLLKDKPDFVLVYGDTNTTLAGALSAAKLFIPVGHVEAGMRSFVADMPEEINRKLTDHISEILFCPTRTALMNLKAEGIRKRIVLSGDVMYELLDSCSASIRRATATLKRHSLTNKSYLLVTVHRAATVDDESNLRALVEILRSLPYPILFPVHPRTQKRFRQFRLWRALSDIKHLHFCEPLGYVDTLGAACHARAVLTDSGGLQKEALFLKTPVLTLRDETEWVETLVMGNRLVGMDKRKIHLALKSLPPVHRPTFLINGRRPSRIVTQTVERLLRERRDDA